MQLRVMSDLHLHPERVPPILPHPHTEDEILILSGDITDNIGYSFTRFIEHVTKYFDTVIYILGNHEHYFGNAPAIMDYLEKSDVILLNNEKIHIEDFAIIGSTLWSDIHSPYSQHACKSNLADFSLIPTTIAQYNDKHIECLEYIDFLSEGEERIIMVTHHAPSLRSIHLKYRGDALNEAFASSVLIRETVELWIHGHTHNHFDYVQDKTRIVCNPYGYNGEYTDFVNNLVIEV